MMDRKKKIFIIALILLFLGIIKNPVIIIMIPIIIKYNK